MRGICGSGAAPSRIVPSTPTRRRPTTPPGSSSRNVLEIGDPEQFDGLDLRVNTSLARDLVEYKRELNKATSFVDQRMSNFVCAALERVVTDDGRYHDYLSPEARAKLLRDVDARQCDAQPGFRHDAVSASRPSKRARGFRRLSRALAGAGEGAERSATTRIKLTAGYQLERADSAAAPVYPPVSRDVRFDHSARAWRGSRREAPQASKPS